MIITKTAWNWNPNSYYWYMECLINNRFVKMFSFDTYHGLHYSREIFNKWQAQRWWAENQDRVIELYNVQRFRNHGVLLPTPPQLEDEVQFSTFMLAMSYNYDH